MRLPLSLIAGLSSLLAVGALARKPKAPARAPSPERLARPFVPKGWKLETASQGDLDGDGKKDLAMVLLTESDPDEIDETEPDFKVTSRCVLVALANRQGKGFHKVAESCTLIPDHSDPRQMDPLLELSVEGGRLRIRTVQGMLMGSWFAGFDNLAFAWDGHGLRLEKAYSSSFHRALGTGSSLDADYRLGRIVRCQRDSALKDPDMEDLCDHATSIDTLPIHPDRSHFLEEVGPQLDFMQDVDSTRLVR